MEDVAAVAAQVPPEMTDRLVEETGIDADPAFALQIGHRMRATFGGFLPQEHDDRLRASFERGLDLSVAPLLAAAASFCCLRV